MEIKNIYGEVIFEDPSLDQRELVKKAVRINIRLDFADLQGWDLSGLVLTAGSFKYANLSRVDFGGAEVYETDFEGADMTMANLKGGVFYQDNFRRTTLRNAMLRGIDLTWSRGIYQFGPIGEFARIGFAIDWGDKVMIQLGCFWGDRKEAIMKIREKYGSNSLYERQINLAAKAVRKHW